MKNISTNKSYAGTQGVYSHASTEYRNWNDIFCLHSRRRRSISYSLVSFGTDMHPRQCHRKRWIPSNLRETRHYIYCVWRIYTWGGCPAPLDQICQDKSFLKPFYLWERTATFQSLRARQKRDWLADNIDAVVNDDWNEWLIEPTYESNRFE